MIPEIQFLPVRPARSTVSLRESSAQGSLEFCQVLAVLVDRGTPSHVASSWIVLGR